MKTLRHFFARFRFTRQESLALVAVFGLYVVGLTWRHVQKASLPFDRDFYAAMTSATGDSALVPGLYPALPDTNPKHAQEGDSTGSQTDQRQTSEQPRIEEEPAPQMDTGRLNINLATERQLTLLPGVGPALAQRIVEYREASGPFQRIDDLTKVKGIGPKKLAKFRGMVLVE